MFLQPPANREQGCALIYSKIAKTPDINAKDEVIPSDVPRQPRNGPLEIYSFNPLTI